MAFHALVLICAANLSTCTLLTTPDGPYAEKTVCEEKLKASALEISGKPQFNDFMAEGNHFTAECVSYPDGYDVEANHTSIMRRLLRQPDPNNPESEG